MSATARILSLQTSPGGLPKLPTDTALLSERGLDGDDWANPKYHGGPKQALLLIGREVIEELVRIGYPVFAGALGENLTTEGLDYVSLVKGQQLRLGEEATIELTKLREPCRTLNRYNPAGLAPIQQLLREQARGGWYAKVLRGGRLKSGDAIAHLS